VPDDTNDVVPMIAYHDGPAAMDWLAAAFGFQEQTRWLADDGALAHGEMLAGSGLIMLATPTPDYESPRRHRDHCARAAAWSRVPWVIDGVLVHVDDVVAHRQQAQRAGATILSEIETGPDDALLYRAEDPEGHRWMFVQRRARSPG
jgi:uncharacterized glyoxalase superfamily protein PhnB